MGGFYSHLGSNFQLPEQRDFCKKKDSSCGYLQQRAGRKWEKRLAVLTGDGLLVLYKFYFYGHSPAIPLIGRIYDVKNCQEFKMTMAAGGSLFIDMTTRKGKKLRFKLNRNESRLCAEALIRCSISDQKEEQISRKEEEESLR